jgi:hypothetical protein
VTVPANITAEATGASGASVSFASSATDIVDGAVSTTCTPASGATFGMGSTTVKCSATDAHGNTGSATFTVTVVDTTAPVVTVPANITAEATGASGASVSFASSATDIVDGAVSTTCTPASGSTFGLGSTTVKCSATDANGNTGSATFTVTVVDTTAPGCNCTPSYNPSTRNVPQASRVNEDGFYLISATDAVSDVTLTLGGYTLVRGETIKITQARGQGGVTLVNDMGSAPVRHFRVGPGDAQIKAVDAAGNVTVITCLVPPPPK